MATRDELKDVFEDTMQWVKSTPLLSYEMERAQENTRIYFEDDYPDFDREKTRDMKVSVTKDRSFQAAMRLRKEHPEAKIAVMNFASPRHPGGGVENGARAQEECLCRISTLYSVLSWRPSCGKYYDYHWDKSGKATDSLIYSEGIVICKTDEDIPKRMPEEDWVKVDVITVAAPNVNPKARRHVNLTKEEQYETHVSRAKHILTCAAHEGIDILVTGAFGCGAFKNNPETVAKAYKKVLAEFPKVFDRIEFAVFCPPNDTRNYDTFHRVLA